jgi:hypothetical protein
MIEPLEARRLMTASLANGTLTIIGTDQSEFLGVRAQDGLLRVNDAGTIRQFNGADVQRILINGGAGDDQIVVRNTRLSVTLIGGAGNDALFGSAGDDDLQGGGGRDVLAGYAGGDLLQGGDANDLLLAGAGNDTLLGQAGDDDRLRGGAGRDSRDYGYVKETIRDAIETHTLTPEQMRDLGIVSLVWRGRAIYAKAGEWILGFEQPPLNEIEWAGPATSADPELLEALAAPRLGIQFDHYLGTKHSVLIRVPTSLKYHTLYDALSGLPKFSHLEPNGVGVLID